MGQELRQVRQQQLIHKDLNVAALVPNWSGDSASVPVGKFFDNIENVAQMGNWSETDKKMIVGLKIQGFAADFLAGEPELNEGTFAALRAAFEHRFEEKLPSQHYYSELQMATQQKNESPEIYADRLKKIEFKNDQEIQ